MKKSGMICIALCIVFAFASCGNLKSQKEVKEKEASSMDSITTEMDSTAKTIGQKTLEVEQAVDDLIKDIE